MGLGPVLHKAAELGNAEVVSFLVREGIDLSIKDANGRTALECAKMLDKAEATKVLEDALSLKTLKDESFWKIGEEDGWA